MNKKILAFFLFLFLIPLGRATTWEVNMNVTNGKGILDTMYQDDIITNVQHFEIDGVGYVKVIYQNGDSRIMELEEYIKSQETQWSQDKWNRDFTSYDLLWHITQGVEWFLGIGNYATPVQKEIIWQLTKIFVTKYEYNLLLLRVEALERTLETVHSEAYCQAKIDMMVEYGMAIVECNGTIYHNQEQIIGITPI